MITSTKTKKILITVPSDKHEEIAIKAKEDRRTISDFSKLALLKSLDLLD